jgi:hypothetical protein
VELSHGGHGGNQKGHLVEPTVISDRAEDLAAQLKLVGGLGRQARAKFPFSFPPCVAEVELRGQDRNRWNHLNAQTPDS